MTPSWFLRLGALRLIIYDAFWKTEHDLLIVIQSNFVFMMHGFRDNEVLSVTNIRRDMQPDDANQSEISDVWKICVM